MAKALPRGWCRCSVSSSRILRRIQAIAEFAHEESDQPMRRPSPKLVSQRRRRGKRGRLSTAYRPLMVNSEWPISSLWLVSISRGCVAMMRQDALWCSHLWAHGIGNAVAALISFVDAGCGSDQLSTAAAALTAAAASFARRHVPSHMLRLLRLIGLFAIASRV